MKRWRKALTTIAIAGAAVLISFTLTQAKKPNNPGGGNGGGGGSGGGQANYTLVPLPDVTGSTNQIDYGFAFAVHELHEESGSLVGVEVVGLLERDAYYWALGPLGEVLAAIPLELPVGADPGTAFTDAYDINDHGTIVGSGGIENSAGNTLYPLFWPDAFSEPVELPLFTDADAYGRAFDVNNNGLIVGIAYLSGARRLVVWGIDIEGGIVGPEVLVEADFFRAPKLNDDGTIVATIDHTQGYRWQVDWDGQDLSVSSPEALVVNVNSQSVPLRVDSLNEFGDVCGTYFSEDGWLQACLLTAGGASIDMPSLVNNKRQGTASHLAWDLTNAADPSQIQVIANAYIYDKRDNYVVGGDTAVLWQGDSVTDLTNVTAQPESNLQFSNTLHFHNTLQAISDNGWIVGAGWDSNGDSAPLVLVPN